MTILINRKISLNQISLFFFVLILGVLPACRYKSPLPEIKKANLTIQDTKYEALEETEFGGPEEYATYHHRIRTRSGDVKPRYTTSYKQAALQTALRQRVEKGVPRKLLEWQDRGPGNVAGRTRAVLVDKRDTTHLTWFAGSASGGIWKTTDGGNNWELKTAGLANLATTTLAGSDANPDIIYAGTGEGFFPLMVQGDGIYKSWDGGENWSLIPATRENPQFENILRMVVDPANPDIVLAATRRSYNIAIDTSGLPTTIGYIMKSTDGGNNWTVVYTTEDIQLGIFNDNLATSVQQIVADPTDFNILYATVRNLGVLKSLDKGDTWSLIFDTGRIVPKFGRIELAVSPINPNILHFATERGFTPVRGSNLYRSSDGGTNWAPVTIPPGIFSFWLGQGWYNNTIAAHPYDENTVIVGGQSLMLSITTSSDSIGIPTISNVINDTRFINLYNPSSDSAVMPMDQFIEDYLGRPLTASFPPLVPIEIRFGIGKSQMAHRHIIGDSFEDTYVDYVEIPFEVWDVLANRQLMVSFMDDDNNGIFTFKEIGANFPDNSPEVLIIHALDYDPNQPTAELNSILNKGYYAVFAGTFAGTELETQQVLPEATISIRTFIPTSIPSEVTPITHRYLFSDSTSKGVHVDHHNLILIPVDNATQNFYIINANDGGIAFSKDAGRTFLQTGDTDKTIPPLAPTEEQVVFRFPTALGYNTSQFYGVDKMNGANRYIGGTQDNNTWISPENPDAASIWRRIGVGDGFEVAWNYTNPNLILFSAQRNVLFKSEDGGKTYEFLPLPTPNGGPFITQIAASKQDPDLIFLVDKFGLLKSTDFGLNWRLIPMPDEWHFNSIRTPLEIALASPQVILTGSTFDENIGLIVSTDEGETFQATNGYPQATLGAITGIATHPTNRNKAYALFSMADGPKILATDDLGQSWRDISGFETNCAESTNGFPDVATLSLLVMPFDTNQIWAGTEVGLFESLDGGKSWHYADNGLPPVMIYEMKIVNDEVILATHGRGIWTVSLPELKGYEPPLVSLIPLINIVDNGLNGKITGTARLRAIYDSTIIEVLLPLENEAPLLIGKKEIINDSLNTELPFELQANLPNTDDILKCMVKITGFRNGQALNYQIETLIYNVDEEDLITNYTNNFDEGKNDFAKLEFDVYESEFFDNQALHSPHPYENFPRSIAVFQKPILVKGTNSILSFDEAVIVEPSGDFATIEATKDNGRTWITLDRYDANGYALWLNAYNFGFQGYPATLRNRQINLSDFFEEGEVVYIRFRLESDGVRTKTAWGWMIDNVEINPTLTTVKALPESIALKNYPNPFTHTTNLEYELSKKSKVQATLYSLDGKLLRTLIQTEQPAGKHRHQVNTDNLAHGMYICRFLVDDGEQILKWVKY